MSVIRDSDRGRKLTTFPLLIRCAWSGVLTCIALILGVAGAPAALAATGYSISSGTWNVRSCPATCAPVDTVTAGALPNLVCQVAGPPVSVSGFGTSNIYDLIKTSHGVLGYVSDLAVAQTLYGQFTPSLPRCDASGAWNSTVAPAASGTGYSWIVTCATKVYLGKVWACWAAGAKYLFTPGYAS